MQASSLIVLRLINGCLLKKLHRWSVSVFAASETTYNLYLTYARTAVGFLDNWILPIKIPIYEFFLDFKKKTLYWSG